MRLILMSLVAAVVLSGCAGGTLDTAGKQGVAFCSSFASVLEKMTLFKQTGNLTAGNIQKVDVAVSIIEPYCTSPTPEAPVSSAVDALDVLLLIALNRGN